MVAATGGASARALWIAFAIGVIVNLAWAPIGFFRLQTPDPSQIEAAFSYLVFLSPGAEATLWLWVLAPSLLKSNWEKVGLSTILNGAVYAGIWLCTVRVTNSLVRIASVLLFFIVGFVLFFFMTILVMPLR